MALESAIVDGDGNGKPIGMTRDISDTASVVGGAYPRMTAVKLEKLDPAPLGNIVAKLARDPVDATKARAIDPGDLIFLCNPFDYWQKIMPATSFRRPDGTWAHDILPIPAETMQTAALESGKAVLGIASRYFAGLGATGKDGTIVQDDSVRFFEDERAYKAKLQGNARPWTLTPSSCWTFPPLTPTPPRWCRLSPCRNQSGKLITRRAYHERNSGDRSAGKRPAVPGCT